MSSRFILRDLMAELSCADRDDHLATVCHGMQLEIIESPSVLTPTLKFGVVLDAASISLYRILIGELVCTLSCLLSYSNG